MGTPAGPLTEAEHDARAEQFLSVARIVHEAGNEWAAVILFYSAYHHVKAALLRDPIWGNPQARATVHVNLTPEDRFVTRHHGGARKDGRVWGVNELVQKLYPRIVGSYERLHQASIDVRYGRGLPSDALDDLLSRADDIAAVAAAGDLVAVS